MHIIQKRNKITLALLVSAATLLVAGGYLAYAYNTKNMWPFANNPTPTEETESTDNVNYSPPTGQEVESGQDTKKDTYNQNTSKPDENTNKQTVSVGIAFADFDAEENAVDIRAFTPDIIEDDGTCTATLVQGDNTVSQSSKAFIDFSSSQCEPILIPTSRFPAKGIWKLTVSYNSSKNSGVSPTMDVEVK